jgi:CheY-like chemotaxis protein
LQARGYAVTVARDGYKALAVVNQVHPHLILMDIQMPRLDGLAAMRSLVETIEQLIHE